MRAILLAALVCPWFAFAAQPQSSSETQSQVEQQPQLRPRGKVLLTKHRLQSLKQTLAEAKTRDGQYPTDSSWLRVKDAWNHDFQYTSDGTTYELKSLGADGKEGGVGDDMDIIIEG